MPATAYSGKDAVFKMDNAAGVLTDVTTYLTDIGFPREPEQLETTTLGSQEKSYIQGFIGASIPISGRYDGDNDAIHDVLSTAVGASGPNKQRSFEYGPTGSDAGMVKYSGEMVVLNYEVPVGASAIVGFTTNARIIGAPTRSTW